MAANDIFPSFAECSRQAREIERNLLVVKPSQIAGSLQSEGGYAIFPAEFEEYTSAYLVSEAQKVERKLFATNYQAEMTSTQPTAPGRNAPPQKNVAEELHRFAVLPPSRQKQPEPEGRLRTSPAPTGVPKIPVLSPQKKEGSQSTPSAMVPTSAAPKMPDAPKIPPEVLLAVENEREAEEKMARDDSDFGEIQQKETELEAEKATSSGQITPPIGPLQRKAEEAENLAGQESGKAVSAAKPSAAPTSKISPRLRAIIEEKLRREEQADVKAGQMGEQADAAGAETQIASEEEQTQEAPAISARERLLRHLQHTGESQTAPEAQREEKGQEPQESGQFQQIEEEIAEKPENGQYAQKEAIKQETAKIVQEPEVRARRTTGIATAPGKDDSRQAKKAASFPDSEPRRDLRNAPIMIKPIFAGDEQGAQAGEKVQDDESELRMQRIARIVQDLSPDKYKAKAILPKEQQVSQPLAKLKKKAITEISEAEQEPEEKIAAARPTKQEPGEKIARARPTKQAQEPEEKIAKARSGRQAQAPEEEQLEGQEPGQAAVIATIKSTGQKAPAKSKAAGKKAALPAKAPSARPKAKAAQVIAKVSSQPKRAEATRMASPQEGISQSPGRARGQMQSQIAQRATIQEAQTNVQPSAPRAAPSQAARTAARAAPSQMQNAARQAPSQMQPAPREVPMQPARTAARQAPSQMPAQAARAAPRQAQVQPARTAARQAPREQPVMRPSAREVPSRQSEIQSRTSPPAPALRTGYASARQVPAYPSVPSNAYPRSVRTAGPAPAQPDYRAGVPAARPYGSIAAARTPVARMAPSVSPTQPGARPRIFPGQVATPNTYLPPIRRRLEAQQEQPEGQEEQQEEPEAKARRPAGALVRRRVLPQGQIEENEQAGQEVQYADEQEAGREVQEGQAGQAGQETGDAIQEGQEGEVEQEEQAGENQEEQEQPIQLSSAKARLKASGSPISGPTREKEEPYERTPEKTQGEMQEERRFSEKSQKLSQLAKPSRDIAGQAELPLEKEDDVDIPMPPPEDAETAPADYEDAKDDFKRKMQQEDIRAKTKDGADVLLEAYAKENLVWLYEIYTMGGMPREDFIAKVKEKMAESGMIGPQAGPEAPNNPALAALGKEIDKRYKK